MECLYSEISNKKSKNTILSLNYRPPNGDTKPFEKHMKSILSKNEATKKRGLYVLIMSRMRLRVNRHSIVA